MKTEPERGRSVARAVGGRAVTAVGTAMSAALLAGACVTVTDNGEPLREPPGEPPGEPRGQVLQTQLQRAPIDDVDLRIAESHPPQYLLYVRAGLPSGCASPHTHDVRRDGAQVEVTVINSVVQSDACTMIYGNYELSINLGSDFEPGQTYAIEVNDERFVFTAQ